MNKSCIIFSTENESRLEQISTTTSKCMFLFRKSTLMQQSTFVQVSSILQVKDVGRFGKIILIISAGQSEKIFVLDTFTSKNI